GLHDKPRSVGQSRMQISSRSQMFQDFNLATQLAVRAQVAALPPRIRGLAAAREAQGHAIAADYDSAMRALDRASTLLSGATLDVDQPVIGTGNLTDPTEMTRGWCLYDLGRPSDAARIIDQQLPLIRNGAMSAHTRYGVRCALAYAAAGDIELNPAESIERHFARLRSSAEYENAGRMVGLARHMPHR
ncbi:MAG: hypothetical protein ABSA03_22290, partial [Streptosporangiaceae bacterium]